MATPAAPTPSSVAAAAREPSPWEVDSEDDDDDKVESIADAKAALQGGEGQSPTAPRALDPSGGAEAGA
eukprot:3454825-Rhodomonas_salina.2